MDKRLKEISLTLSEYSLGNFDKRLTISSSLDEVDGIMNGINMLGDELKSVTISRNYFTNIFNCVSDMVFVLNNKGLIENANKSAENQLKYEGGCLLGKSINILQKGKLSYFKLIKNRLEKNTSDRLHDDVFYTKTGDAIPVRMNLIYFKNEPNKRLILLTATDITFQMKTENLIIRAIIDTQEKERQRLAKDLHDSLTQQLSAIKFHISTTADQTKVPAQKKNLQKSNEALTYAINDMRNICFNLMPRTLHEFGLIRAVREFCKYFLVHREVNFDIQQNSELPDLTPELKIDLYRVIQEFVNNAEKHGKANNIKINFNFSCNRKLLKIILSDNGRGFNTSHIAKGMGLQNVHSRVKSHKGDLIITSSIIKGTQFKINIPLILKNGRSQN